MTGTVDVITISSLACICVYLWMKRDRSGTNKSTSSETIPLLEERESRLEKGTRLLRENKIKHQKLQDEFKEKVEEAEAQTATLEKEKSKQQAMGDELAARSEEVGKREAKLKDDNRLFEEEKLVQAKKIESRENEIEFKAQKLESRENEVESKKQELESRENEVQSKAQNLESREDEVQSKAQNLESRENEVKSKAQELESRENEVESKLKEDLRLAEEKYDQQQNLEESLSTRIEKVEKREAELGNATDFLEEQRAEQDALKENLQKRVGEVEAREAFLDKAVTELSVSKAAATTIVEKKSAEKDEQLEVEAIVFENDVQVPHVVEEEEPSSSAITSKEVALGEQKVEEEASVEQQEPASLALKEVALGEQKEEEEASVAQQEPAQSDAEKRKIMIEEELQRLVKQTNETELSEENPFDDDSLEALKKAAMKICYVRKFYNVMKDDFVYFPSVARTALDYRLIEEAEKLYFEEEDEYPMDLSSGLRSVAVAIITEEEDDDMDEDYMNAVAQDVEL